MPQAPTQKYESLTPQQRRNGKGQICNYVVRPTFDGKTVTISLQTKDLAKANWRAEQVSKKRSEGATPAQLRVWIADLNECQLSGCIRAEIERTAKNEVTFGDFCGALAGFNLPAYCWTRPITDQWRRHSRMILLLAARATLRQRFDLSAADAKTLSEATLRLVPATWATWTAAAAHYREAKNGPKGTDRDAQIRLAAKRQYELRAIFSVEFRAHLSSHGIELPEAFLARLAQTLPRPKAQPACPLDHEPLRRICDALVAAAEQQTDYAWILVWVLFAAQHVRRAHDDYAAQLQALARFLPRGVQRWLRSQAIFRTSGSPPWSETAHACQLQAANTCLRRLDIPGWDRQPLTRLREIGVTLMCSAPHSNVGRLLEILDRRSAVHLQAHFKSRVFSETTLKRFATLAAKLGQLSQLSHQKSP